MKTLHYLLPALACICLMGCTGNESFPDNGGDPARMEMVVLQKRDPAYPLTDYAKLKEET